MHKSWILFALCLVLSAVFMSANATDSGGMTLKRVDFNVTGSSCVTCLRRVAKKLKGASGVLKADVSIFKPYAAIVVYDASQTNLQKVFNAVSDEGVKMVEVQEKSLSHMPAVLLPRGLDTSLPK